MIVRVWIMATSIALVAACATTSPGEPSAQDLKVEVAAVIDRYLKAIEVRDEGAIRAAYVADDRFA
jgi:uncharacterized protein involved in high-affinity Fe2+ transport